MIRPRKKPRPGRLKGNAMTALRSDVFTRDGYRCQHIPHPRTFPGMICGKRVTWESGHLCHRRNRRMWGDTPENTFTGCEDCHIRKQHAYGPSMTKPCPPKQERMEA